MQTTRVSPPPHAAFPASNRRRGLPPPLGSRPRASTGGGRIPHSAFRILHSKGFTLVEILVVVLIITILATVVGIRVANQPGQARVAAAKAQLMVFRTGLNLYRMNHGQVPTAAQGLEALCREPTRPPVPQGYPQEGYIESRTVPNDPWGKPYVYLVPGPDGLPYDVVTYGADGEPGGTGENADLSLSGM